MNLLNNIRFRADLPLLRLRHTKDAEGSITLEAAIALPVTILVLVMLIRMMQSHEAELLWKGAHERTSEEAGLVLSGLALEDIDEASAPDLSDLAGKTVSAALLNLRRNHWFSELTSEKPHLRGLIRYDNGSLERHRLGYLEWSSDYSLTIGNLESARSYRTFIPVWSSVTSEQTPEEREENNEIWEADNFERGRYFRAKYGGNLPANFRVLSGFRNGEALLIKSIDLTAPTWQISAALEREIRIQSDRLSSFVPEPQEVAILGSSVISSRKLILVIPSNSPESGIRLLETMRIYASARSVTLDIRMDSESARYT